MNNSIGNSVTMGQRREARDRIKQRDAKEVDDMVAAWKMKNIEIENEEAHSKSVRGKHVKAARDKGEKPAAAKTKHVRAQRCPTVIFDCRQPVPSSGATDLPPPSPILTPTSRHSCKTPTFPVSSRPSSRKLFLLTSAFFRKKEK